MSLSAHCIASIHSVFSIPAIRSVGGVERSISLGKIRAADSEILLVVSSSTVALIVSKGREVNRAIVNGYGKVSGACCAVVWRDAWACVASDAYPSRNRWVRL